LAIGLRGVVPGRLKICDWDMPTLLLCMPAPGSYTTQDVVELQVPGSPLLLERVVDELVESGRARGLAVRHAVAGEYTYRAWHAGRLSLDRAESVAAMIAAHSEAGLTAARRSFDGGVSAVITPVVDQVAGVLARVEAGIDFADEEDVVAITVAELRESLAASAEALHQHLRSFRGGEAPEGLPRVVLRGPANAGKSTLFNALLGADRVVTDAQPGTTRDAIVEHATFGGVSMLLVDTPGDEGASYAAADDAEEEADLIVQCSTAPCEDAATPDGVLSMRTKRDLRDSQSAGPRDVSAFDPADIVRVRQWIAASISTRRSHGGEAVLAVSLRQRSLAEGAASAIVAAMNLEPLDGVGLTRPAEVASMLREALDRLGAIVGTIPPDDVLDRVFASFCIGK
jgi:tRNA modification GTPase